MSGSSVLGVMLRVCALRASCVFVYFASCCALKFFVCLSVVIFLVWCSITLPLSCVFMCWAMLFRVFCVAC